MGKSIANKFGTAPVFFTAISTILGAVLFLRFGYAVGTLGFFGVFLIIILGHLVTLPTAMAISEIATNQRVEGGGEYFIISRSFGLNIGATIGIALFLSQAISVAFYIIAFTEAFSPIFSYILTEYGLDLPRQIISIPSMALLALLIIKKGANIGIKALYIVVVVLFVSLLAFFLGDTEFSQTSSVSFFDRSLRNPNDFFIVFAIVFPAFTGMTAGVGLSGDLKNPQKSIPLGSLAATVVGMIIYLLVIWKLSGAASPDALVGDQLIMSKIALYGFILIPLGLGASTLSSAIGSILVAPRTLQAIGLDKSFPIFAFNGFISKGKGDAQEPYNATLITCAIAMVFVAIGDVNAVAEVISMFFMVTYGAICLISFLHHFGSAPSYRPTFKSRWYISLLGFVLCLYLMIEMNATYTLLSIIFMVIIYFVITNYHKDRNGMESIFQGAIFQLSRRIQVYMQKSRKMNQTWRPSIVCISEDSFVREKAFDLLKWISYKNGFGTYLHLIKGYFSKTSYQESQELLTDLIAKSSRIKGNMYIDTIISPSFTSAIAQVLQLPSPSGMDNNLIMLEYDKAKPDNLGQIIENLGMAQAGNFDICVLGSSYRNVLTGNGINIWIRNLDDDNAGLMILLGFIILGHPDWNDQVIRIFSLCEEGELESIQKKINDFVLVGRLPISEKNIEVIERKQDVSFKSLVNKYSKDAGLTLIGFQMEQVNHEGLNFFEGYEKLGDIVFVHSKISKDLN